ncbi:hypothetical protein E2C01_016771 [Portunus trituberculatus]|uniref:Uncharacterized protein n=1 Tax=Portunus trituberculatus TaxID=210409 RepID=A0A5B7DPY8_PORTR|nr:hypothetical protein [Portunus trituberculatus]
MTTTIISHQHQRRHRPHYTTMARTQPHPYLVLVYGGSSVTGEQVVGFSVDSQKAEVIVFKPGDGALPRPPLLDPRHDPHRAENHPKVAINSVFNLMQKGIDTSKTLSPVLCSRQVGWCALARHLTRPDSPICVIPASATHSSTSPLTPSQVS